MYAQTNLGSMYFDGFGVTRNPKAAFIWYQKAANQGFAAAQFNLGKMYEDGIGVKKDENKAIRFYIKSAAQGNTDAQAEIRSLAYQQEPSGK